MSPHCRSIYEVIKDYDDDISYGYSAEKDCAKSADFSKSSRMVLTPAMDSVGVKIAKRNKKMIVTPDGGKGEIMKILAIVRYEEPVVQETAIHWRGHAEICDGVH